MSTPISTAPVTRAQRARHAVLLVAAVALWIVPLVAIPLTEPDEGRYGEIPREMLISGEFLTPRLAGTLYFEKPPLHYWLTASALRVLGESPLAVRFWTALLGVATAAVIYGFGRWQFDRATGALAAGLLLASPYFFSLAHIATLDMTLTFFVTVSLAGFWVAHRADSASRSARGWWALFAGSALATMTKGLIGIVLPGAIVFLYLLATGGWDVLRRVPWLRGTALFLLLAAPWHVAMARTHAIFLQYYFVHEHFLRYATPVADRAEPVWYFVAILLVGCIPWIGALPVLGRLRSGAEKGGWRAFLATRRDVAFLACWVLFPLVFFSTSHSKLAPYVLPVAPALALLVAAALREVARRGEAWRPAERWGLSLGAITVAAVGAVAAAAAAGFVPKLNDRPEVHWFPLLLGLATASAGVVAAWSALRGGIDPSRLIVRLVGLTALATAMLWSLVAVEAPSRSSRQVAEVLAPRLEPGDRVFCVGGYRQTLPFYLGRLVDSAGPQKDLAFGVSQLPAEVARDRFPSYEELRELWGSPQRVYLVVDRDLERLRQHGLEGGTVLFTGKRMLLVVNHPPAGG